MRRVSLVLALAVVASSFAVLAQAPASLSNYRAPRTPWGDPDLQGIWPGTDMVGVPFERPKEFGTRLFLTDAELKAMYDYLRSLPPVASAAP